MKELLLSMAFFICFGIGLSSQPFEPSYSVEATIDPQTKHIKGHCRITVQSSLSDISLNLWANQFQSKTTDFANYTLENYSNYFYFFKEDELGGYKNVKLTANGYDIPVSSTSEMLSIELPPNGTQDHTIEISFELKLPKLIEGFGYSEERIYLKNWYPTLKYHDGKSWATSTYYFQSVLPEAFGSHNVTIHLPEKYKINKAKGQEMSIQDSTYQLISTGKCPRFSITRKISNPDSQDSTNTQSLHSNSMGNNPEKAYPECQAMIKNVLDFYQKHLNKVPEETLIKNCPGRDFGCQWLRKNLEQTWQNDYHLDSAGTVFAQVLSIYYVNEYIKTLEPDLRKKMENKDGYASYPIILEKIRSFDDNPSLPYFFRNDEYTYFTKCCGKYIGSALFAQLEAYLGPDSFLAGLDEYLKSHTHKQISFDGLIHYLSGREKKDLVEFLVNHQSVDKLSNYEITNVTLGKDSTFIDIQNTGGSKPPFSIEAKNILGYKVHWFNGFTGAKQIGIPNGPSTAGKMIFRLDGNTLLRESSNENQIVKVDYNRFPPEIKIKDQKYQKNKIGVEPSLGYNFGDKFMAGLYLKKNDPVFFKGLFFSMMPMYSFSAKRVVGQAEIGYAWFPVKGAHRYSASLLAKSYDKFYQKNLDYRERFVKIQPSFSVDFINRKEYKSYGFEFLPVFLWEEEGQFDSEGKFTGTSYQQSNIWRGNYWYEKESKLGDLSLEVWFEQQRYATFSSAKKADYGKFTFIVNKEFYLSQYYVFQARFFASAFAWNTQKNSSSYNPVFTRGSIALAHQAVNDYLYDEDYIVRDNQNLGMGQQVSFYQGGGFKHATGSQFQVGVSNRYAAAINLEADFPLRRLNFLKFYLDTGVYGNVENKASLLYAAGLSLHIKESVKIYYPLFMSKELSAAYPEEVFTWRKLSFAFTLDELFEEF